MTAGIDYPTLDRAVREVLVLIFPPPFRWLWADPDLRAWRTLNAAQVLIDDGRAVQRYHALMAEKRHASRERTRRRSPALPARNSHVKVGVAIL